MTNVRDRLYEPPLAAGFAVDADAPRTRDAWERYVRRDGLHPDMLRGHVYRAWQRCDAMGASAHTRVARALSPPGLAAVLDEERDLLDASRPYLDALSRAAGSDNHAAMLGNRDGAVLRVVGDEEHILAPGFPSAGSLLDEATSGANGIGTSLAEGHYVELVGPEHFISGFHAYTCQGLPLRAPDRSVVGVLSMSVRRVQAAERVREILACAARGVEAELMRRRLEDDTRRLIRADSAAGEPFERLRQDVIQLQAAARLKLESAALAARRASMRDAVKLALAAEGLIARFGEQSALWLQLATEEVGAPQRLDLQARATELAELLATEASVRRVTITVSPQGPVEVRTDPLTLSRELFRALMRALAASLPGGTITVRVDVRDDRARVAVTPSDATLEFELAAAAA